PGAGFPDVKPDPTRQGPSLAGMGGMHPAEYFAESVLNPNAVIVTGPGFTGPDGLSIMPDYRASLTDAETDDLLPSLRRRHGRRLHYRAAVAPPADTSKVTVASGKPTIAVMGRPARAATSVTFEWRP